MRISMIIVSLNIRIASKTCWCRLPSLTRVPTIQNINFTIWGDALHYRMLTVEALMLCLRQLQVMFIVDAALIWWAFFLIPLTLMNVLGFRKSYIMWRPDVLFMYPPGFLVNLTTFIRYAIPSCRQG